MPVQHSPPARQTISQARAQSVFTPTPRAPLDGTPAVPQLRAPFGRKEEGREDHVFQEYGEDEEENSMEEEEYEGTESVPARLGAYQDAEGPLQASLISLSHQSEPSLLAMMQKMTQNIANHQAAASSEASRPLAFKTPSMKEPE
ncbi:hypothetical protein O181_073036 [Austropuccinia psidii MF-1]|uniref:Uncharacterized protein n=1 Tax=Austropuccinia psidii MF-1 TaxID=1389203 RepID=A0A9Q3I7X3_9BASI|nr:hypothetical protein [Austropuccinia psidii MF-1]